MKKKVIFNVLFAVIVLNLFFINFSFAYVTSNPAASNQPLPGLNPLNIIPKLDLLKSFADQKGIGTTLPSLNFNLVNTKNLSFSDIPGSFKAVAMLAVNLFLIVIQTLAGVLKALLPFLSK